MKKIIFICFLVLIIGASLSVMYSFISGSDKYREICVQSKTMTQEEYFQNNYYGFENCDKNGIALGSIYEGFIITAFALQFILIIFEKNLDVKKCFIIFLITILSFLFLVTLEQIFFNIFPSIGYEGWQDAGWTINHETSLIRDFREFNERPTALPFDIVVLLIFSLTSSLGLFLSGLIFKSWKEKVSKYLSIPVVLIVSIILQIFIFIITFPITLWFGLSFM